MLSAALPTFSSPLLLPAPPASCGGVIRICMQQLWRCWQTEKSQMNCLSVCLCDLSNFTWALQHCRNCWRVRCVQTSCACYVVSSQLTCTEWTEWGLGSPEHLHPAGCLSDRQLSTAPPFHPHLPPFKEGGGYCSVSNDRSIQHKHTHLSFHYPPRYASLAVKSRTESKRCCSRTDVGDD